MLAAKHNTRMQTYSKKMETKEEYDGIILNTVCLSVF